MEGVLFSDGTREQTIDALEMLLDLDCRNIWTWIYDKNTYNEFKKEGWEETIHFQSCHSDKSCIRGTYDNSDDDDDVPITTTCIGDCLRSLYTRNESRDNLYIIGDVKNMPSKLSLHNNFSKKYTGIVLLANGTTPFTVEKGALKGYGEKGNKQGYCLDIAFCNPSILGLFYDNFDCDTFHQLLASNPIGYEFSCVVDKRIIPVIKKDIVVDEKDIETDDFMVELVNMISVDVSKLELNSLRLAYGKMFTEFTDILLTLSRPDLVQLFEKA
uniref:Uncharacterized protein n=1 Tax=viral metagenome TaxID=1070528 RepID=A0A6C0JRP1_9ZZZZ